jgi:hypothetical protein
LNKDKLKKTLLSQRVRKIRAHRANERVFLTHEKMYLKEREG